jgi:hypothetical protein
MNIAALINRARNICLSPASEWPVIEAEQASVQSIYLPYVLVLAAIGPLAGFIGMTLVGYGIPFLGTYRVPVLSGLGIMLTQYVVTLVLVFVLALIIDALAPTFGGTKDPIQPLKLAAYSMTPAWLAGVLGLFPGFLLGTVALLLSLYGIYLLYKGLPVLMKCPPDKATVYTVVLVIVWIVLSLVLSAVLALLRPGMPGMPGRMGEGPAISTPGSANDKLAKLDEWSKRMEAAGKQAEEAAKKAEQSGKPEDAAAAMQSAIGALGAAMGGGQVEPVDFRQLQALLPESTGGLARRDPQGEKVKMGGFAVSSASARYEAEGKSIELKITDAGGAAALPLLAGWAMIETDRETANGYEKTGKRDGRPFQEEFSKSASSGEYNLLVAGRFVVSAQGRGVPMDALRAAVDAVGLARLEAMKNQGAKSP